MLDGTVSGSLTKQGLVVVKQPKQEAVQEGTACPWSSCRNASYTLLSTPPILELMEYPYLCMTCRDSRSYSLTLIWYTLCPNSLITAIEAIGLLYCRVKLEINSTLPTKPITPRLIFRRKPFTKKTVP